VVDLGPAARAVAPGKPRLEDQDRRRWDFSAIRRGLAALAKASTRGLGPYGLQAAIAAAHASAPSVEATDWDRIVVLYEALGRVAHEPIRCGASFCALGVTLGEQMEWRTSAGSYVGSAPTSRGLPGGRGPYDLADGSRSRSLEQHAE
jgi:hypothetical protein